MFVIIMRTVIESSIMLISVAKFLLLMKQWELSDYEDN